MKYETAKEKSIEARQAVYEAKQAVTLAETKLNEHQQQLPKIYEEMTAKLAEAEAGEIPKKEAEQAQKNYQKAIDKLQELKQNIDVAKKLKPIRLRQEREALSVLRETAKSYWPENVDPLLNKIIEAVETLSECSNEVETLGKELRQAGLRESEYLPSVLKFKIDTGKRIPETPERFIETITNLKSK